MKTTGTGAAARRALMIAVLSAATVTLAAQQEQQPPRFRATVDVIPVDVTVIDRNGFPVLDLTADDFTVTIDGRPRRIVSLAAPASRPATPEDAASARGGATPARIPLAPTAPRPVVLIFDQPNTRFGAIGEHRAALHRFVDGLASADPISVVNLGAGARSIGFTLNRAEVRRAIDQAIGGQPYPPLNRTPGEQTMEILSRLIVELQGIGGAKTIILVTENPVFGEQRPLFERLRREAALARTTVHVLRLHAPATSAALADPRPDTAPEPDGRNIITTPQPTETINGVTIPAFQRDGPNVDPLDGLEGITGVAFATGGFVFNVVNTADAALDRVTATLAGYYLVGVESLPIDADGRLKPIQVTVRRPDVTVSARRFFAAR